MGSNLYLLYIALMMVGSGSYLIGAPSAVSKRVIVTVGEDKVIELNGGNLKISRKGIIYAEKINSGRWRLSGLKKGLVLVLVQGDQNEKLDHFFVEVVNRPEGFRDLKWTLFLCRYPGVKCIEKTHTISGVVESWDWFVKARSFCRKKQFCIWNVRISELEKKRQENRLRKVIAQISDLVIDEVTIHDTGDAFLLLKCQKWDKRIDEKIKAILGVNINRNITGRCNERQSKVFNVKSQLVFRRSSNVSRLGVDWLPGAIPDWNALRAELVTGKAAIVASPTIKVLSGDDNTIRHGVEVLYEDSEEPKTRWRSVGMTLKVKVDPVGERVRLVYEMSMSQPQGGYSQLQSNGLSGTVDLPIGKPAIVGTFQMNVRTQNIRNFPILQSLPIVGPLFGIYRQDFQDGLTYLIVTITNEEEINLPSESESKHSRVVEWPLGF